MKDSGKRDKGIGNSYILCVLCASVVKFYILPLYIVEVNDEVK